MGRMRQLSTPGVSPRVSFLVYSDLNLNEFHSVITSKRVNLESKKIKLNLEKININIDGSLKEGGYLLGRSQAQIAAMKFSTSAGQQLQSKEINLSSDSWLKERKLGGKMEISMDQLTYLGEKFGLAEMAMAYKDLNFDTLLLLEKERIKKIKANASNVQINQMMGEKLIGMLGELLKYSPRLDVSYLRLISGQLKFEAKAGIGVNAKNNKIDDPVALLKHLDANVDVKLPKDLLVQIYSAVIQSRLGEHTQLSEQQLNLMAKDSSQSLMQQMLKKKIFKIENDVYKLNAELKAGQLTINGEKQALPIPLL